MSESILGDLKPPFRVEGAYLSDADGGFYGAQGLCNVLNAIPALEAERDALRKQIAEQAPVVIVQPNLDKACAELQAANAALTLKLEGAEKVMDRVSLAEALFEHNPKLVRSTLRDALSMWHPTPADKEPSC